MAYRSEYLFRDTFRHTAVIRGYLKVVIKSRFQLTEKGLAYLRENWTRQSDKTISQVIGCSASTILKFRKELGLLRTDEDRRRNRQEHMNRIRNEALSDPEVSKRWRQNHSRSLTDRWRSEYVRDSLGLKRKTRLKLAPRMSPEKLQKCVKCRGAMRRHGAEIKKGSFVVMNYEEVPEKMIERAKTLGFVFRKEA